MRTRTVTIVSFGSVTPLAVMRSDTPGTGLGQAYVVVDALTSGRGSVVKDSSSEPSNMSTASTLLKVGVQLLCDETCLNTNVSPSLIEKVGIASRICA